MLNEIFSTVATVLPTKANRLYNAILTDIHLANKDGSVAYPPVGKVRALIGKGIDVNEGLGNLNIKVGPFHMTTTDAASPLEVAATQYGYIAQYLQHGSSSAMINTRQAKKREDGKGYEAAFTRALTKDELREYLSSLREISQVLIDAGANPQGAAQIMAQTVKGHQDCVEKDKKNGRPNFVSAEARARWKPETLQPELMEYLAQLTAAQKAYDQHAALPPKSSKKGPRHG